MRIKIEVDRELGSEGTSTVSKKGNTQGYTEMGEVEVRTRTRQGQGQDKDKDKDKTRTRAKTRKRRIE